MGAAAAALWVYPAGMVLLLGGSLALADPRCDEHANAHPRLNPEGIPWAIGAGLLWAAPFVGVALVRRNKVTITLAGAAAVVSTVVVWYLLTHPSEGFCF